MVCHRHGTDCAIFTYGTLVNEAMAAADMLETQGINACVLRLTKVAPLDLSALEAALCGVRKVLIVEEAAAAAGIGHDLASRLSKCLPDTVFAVRDLGTEYVTHGSVMELYRERGLDAGSIEKKMREVLSDEN